MRAILPILLLSALACAAAPPSSIECPRNCICTSGGGSIVARCNRLDIDTQKFTPEITNLIVDNPIGKFPVKLTDGMLAKMGLSYVTNLEISNSLSLDIDRRAFDQMDSLFSVNISGNNITHLHPETFNKTNELYLLSLSNNPKIFSEMSDSFKLLEASNVQELDISRSSIVKLGPATFSGMIGLKYINLADNKLTELHPDLFTEQKGLEEIDLSNNNLKVLPPNLFRENAEMTTLTLKNNPLESIAEINVKELLSLEVSNAHLDSLGPTTFNGIPFISNLILSGNKIRKIFSQSFSNLTDLSFLDLSNNQIEILSDQMIKENVDMEIFKIANNTALRKLPTEGFVCNDDKFSIYLFDASGCSLEIIYNNTFKTMPDITQLLLARNKISSFGSALQNLGSLIELDLSANLIGILDVASFSGNPELKKLNLAGNPLISISTNMFAKNSLTWLDVSSCRLFQLWSNNEEPKKALQKLNYFNVSNNDFKQIDVEDLNLTPKLVTLDISNNQFKCDDAFENLLISLTEKGVTPNVVNEKLEIQDKTKDNSVKLSSWNSLSKEICSKTSEEIEYYDITDDKEDDDDENYDDADKDDDDEDDSDDDDENYGDIEKADPVESNETSNSKETKEEFKPDDVFKAMKEFDNEIKLTNLLKSKIDDIDIKEITSLDGNVFQFDEESNLYFDRNNNTLLIAEIDLAPSHWHYATRVGIILSVTFFILGLLRCLLLCRKRQSGPMCTVITDIGSHGKIKTDSGLVYQQLSEDLTAPRTPIIRKHHMIYNITKTFDESRGLKDTKNFPEAV